jgi:hypothetical protein
MAQIVGGIAATLFFRWLAPDLPAAAKNVVMSEEVDRVR